MTRERLVTASDRLESAAEATDSDEARERLSDLADQLQRLSTADEGPDHGRLARLQTALAELADGDAADVAASIDEADDAIVAYRETLDGV